SRVVEVNRAIAAAEAEGREEGLPLVDRLELDGYQYFHSTRADLLRRLGRADEARAAFERALELAGAEPERRFLQRRIAEVSGAGPSRRQAPPNRKDGQDSQQPVAGPSRPPRSSLVESTRREDAQMQLTASTDQLQTDGPRKGWTLALASLGLFMVALDTLVVTTALPVMRVDLGASLPDLEWTVNIYNLAFACLLLTGAALGDRFGRRRMFAIGLSVFTAASAAAALSPTVGALIAARAFQGAGAALVMPLTLTLISAAFPAEKRGAAIGLWGGIAGLAVAAGPVVGGAVVDGINWHWIFWLNVPIGLVLIPLALALLNESFGPRPQLDLIGLALAGAGMLGLTWGLVRANTVGWGTAEVALTLAVGAALVAGFVAWERRARSPMLPLELFRYRGFSTANAVSFFMYAGLFGTLFLMAQFLQNALGYSPLQAGIRLLPWTATPMLIAPLAGGLADRFGNRPFMVIGMIMQAVGLGWV